MVGCEATRAMELSATETTIRASDSHMCEGAVCEAVALFPLARGERLRVRLREGAGPGVEARLLLAPRDYTFRLGVLFAGFGAPIASAKLDGEHAVMDVSVDVSGFYKLRVIGPAEAAAEVCVVSGPGQ
jgi:hypothetical protein